MKSYADCIIDCFNHKSYDRVIWQPRYLYWFNHYVVPANLANYHQFEQYTPREYIGKDILEIAEDIGCSIRYSGEIGIHLFHESAKPEANIKRRGIKNDDGSTTEVLETPVGSISQTSKNGYNFDHWVKKIEDLKVVQYWVENTEFRFNQDGYRLAMEIMSPEFGLPTAYYFRSPYMKCVINYIGFEKTVIFLRRNPKEMESFMNALEEWDRKQYQNEICPSPLKWVNFGENIDGNLAPPTYFKKYLMEYYHSRVKMLKNSGKFSFIHIDGSFKTLLPLLSELPMDGIEALTPPPQGDVDLEELYKYTKDSGKILLDLIPATLFMKEFSESRLEQETKKILDLFFPNLILGISDELCMGDGRRLKTVAKVVQLFNAKL